MSTVSRDTMSAPTPVPTLGKITGSGAFPQHYNGGFEKSYWRRLN